MNDLDRRSKAGRRPIRAFRQAIAAILAGMLATFGLVSPAFAAPQTIFSDSFSGGLGSWSVTPDTWRVESSGGNPGGFAFGAPAWNGGSTMVRNQSTVGYEDITLDFDLWIPAAEAGSSVGVGWYNGSSWQSLGGWTAATGGWIPISLNLPAAAANKANFALRFVMINPPYGESDFEPGIDNVVLAGEPLPVDAGPPWVTATSPVMGGTMSQSGNTTFWASFEDDLTSGSALIVDFIFSAGMTSYTYPRHQLDRTTPGEASRSISGWQLADTLGISPGDTFDWTIAVTDLAGNTVYHDVTNLEYTASPGLPPTILTPSPLPHGVPGTPYEAELEADGTGPLTWSHSTPLPDGLSLDAATGVISGTPTTVGVTNVNICVANGAGSVCAIRSLHVQQIPQITTDHLSDAAVGASYTFTLTATGVHPALFGLNWSIVSGVLPNGLSLHPTDGEFVGTPTEDGTFTFEVQVQNAVGSDTRSFTLLVTPGIVPPDILTLAGDVPDGVVDVPYHFAFEVAGTDPGLAISGALPPGLSFSGASGTISGVPTEAGTWPVMLFATRYDPGTDTLHSDDLSFSITIHDVPPAPVSPVIAATTLPDGLVWVPYSHTFSTSAGTGPIEWLVSGADWLNIDPDSGELSGLPVAEGTFPIEVTATGPGGSDTESYSILVGEAPGITTAAPLPEGAVGTPYSVTFAATGSTPITWSTTTALPDGLSLAPDGTLSGTPNETAAMLLVEIEAENAFGTHQRSYALTILAASVAPTITTASLPDATEDTPYSVTLTATGTGPLTWAETSPLPDGLNLASDGTLSGTPSTPGPTTVAVQVTGPGGTDAETFTLEILALPETPVITTTTLPDATVGVLYSVTLTATGTGPLTWAETSPLPDGLNLASDGTLSGVPSTPGPTTVAVQVTGPGGTDAESFTIEIAAPPVAPDITTTALPDATAGSPYSATLTAGGTGPMSWSAISGVPTGLTLTAAGILTGTPAGEGPFPIEVLVSGPGGTDTVTLELLVLPASGSPAGSGGDSAAGIPGTGGEAPGGLLLGTGMLLLLGGAIMLMRRRPSARS